MLAIIFAAALTAPPAEPTTAKELYKACAARNEMCLDYMTKIRVAMSPELCESRSHPVEAPFLMAWFVDTAMRQGDSMVNMTAEEAARKVIKDYLGCSPVNPRSRP